MRLGIIQGGDVRKIQIPSLLLIELFPYDTARFPVFGIYSSNAKLLMASARAVQALHVPNPENSPVVRYFPPQEDIRDKQRHVSL